MPTQVYKCLEHGKFDWAVSFGEDVPKKVRCPHPVKLELCGSTYTRPCDWWSPWVPQVPAFPGGPTTGAKKE